MNNKKIAQLFRELAQEFETVTDSHELDYWTINIPKGLTEEQVYEDCKELFSCSNYIELKNITSVRTSKKAYFIKVKANIEADKNLKNLSANDLKEKGINGITLLERLVLEKDYFKKTGQHLDIDNITLCSGSCNSDGRFPGVFWYGDGLRVRWSSTGNKNPVWRAREVIF